jgi:RNA polymerase sigma-70 factor (ECF subfamily)
LHRAAQAWPETSTRAEEFVHFMADRFPETDDPLGALEALRIEELALCFTCLSGSQRALLELEKVFVAAAGAALGRLGLSHHAQEEAMQRARAKLLAGGANAEPKLAQYSGQGSLGGWIRVVVVRTALNAQRSERRLAPRNDDVLATRLAEDARDPELDIIKARYSQTLADAVSAAFRRLTSEQRNLLRMYVIDGLTLAELGRMRSVDASTISRWLARIRAKLLEEARNHLMEEHAMHASECESLMRVVRSGLHVTIERLLATENPDTVDG